MNKENLLKMADYIETIPQNKFDMINYRKNMGDVDVVCNSIGCAVGHCTILDMVNIQNNFIDEDDGQIKFFQWSEDFTGVNDMPQWNYLFTSKWRVVDNTTQGTANRIRHVVKHGFPIYMELKY